MVNISLPSGGSKCLWNVNCSGRNLYAARYRSFCRVSRHCAPWKIEEGLNFSLKEAHLRVEFQIVASISGTSDVCCIFHLSVQKFLNVLSSLKFAM